MTSCHFYVNYTCVTMSKLFFAAISELLDPEEFLKLRRIGGHKVYHLEGNALIHTEMVYYRACEMFSDDSLMCKVALLHDIGKIYTSVYHGPDDWSYPNHALAGAAQLHQFVSPGDPDFETIGWYIKNHIKPMFWRGDYLTKEIASLNCPATCSVINLLKLVVCDVVGSVSVEPQDKLLQFLTTLIGQYEYAIAEAAKYGLEDEVLRCINAGMSADEALDEWVK